MHDPVTPLLLQLAILLGAAKLAGWLSTRMGQPAVLGEIVIGIVFGNLWLFGYQGFEPMKTDPVLEILAGLGVILLLFEVGLESTVAEMLKVGRSSVLVAVLGVVAPFGLGWAAGAWLLPSHSPIVHAFLGAVLTATSVGITARVLRDLNQGGSIEAKIILGAAVFDDVLGLVILAALTGIVSAAGSGRAALSIGEVAWISAKALGFLVGALLLGVWLAPRLMHAASRIRVTGMLVTSALVFCFVLAYLGTLAGLSPIVGAFAAGLILETPHFKNFEEIRERSIESLLHPISAFLVPLFFVLTGLRVEMRAFGEGHVALLALVLTIVAWIGKQACSFGVLERGVNRLAIGLGMVPRGEVGLIFANVGATLTIGGERVITPPTYAAVVMMVIVTTLVTPPALQWSLKRRRKKRGA
jgi:Kef-type K+ transport system membrane component KefB